MTRYYLLLIDHRFAHEGYNSRLGGATSAPIRRSSVDRLMHCRGAATVVLVAFKGESALIDFVFQRGRHEKEENDVRRKFGTESGEDFYFNYSGAWLLTR